MHYTRQEGIEPPTRSLEGCRSIQLSYWRFLSAARQVLVRSKQHRGGRIRTGDLLLPKQARYRTTLRPARTPRVTGSGSLVNGRRRDARRATR